MATAIFFGGRRINIPGAYSDIDASSLAGVSPSSTGIVALVGIAEGGKPQSVETAFSDAVRPETIRQRFRSGPLKVAGQFAFQPSADQAIPGGAQRVVSVKVNKAIQGTATFKDGAGVDTLTLTAEDWGEFTNQIATTIEDGTVDGKKITITFEDVVEVFDDVGGEAKFDVLYTPGASGYATAVATLNATTFSIAATSADTGLDAERDNDIPANGAIQVVSDNAGDTTQTVTVTGLDASNVPISETLTLNGVTDVVGTVLFEKVTGTTMSAAAVGTVQVETSGGVTILFTYTVGQVVRGTKVFTNGLVSNSLITVSIDTDTAVDVVIRGTNAAGTAVAERFDMTAGDTTPVVGIVPFKFISSIELGDVAIARTITSSLTAFSSTHSSFPTVSLLVNQLNDAAAWITSTAITPQAATFQLTRMDYVTAVSVLTLAEFSAEIDDIVTTLNEQSGLVTAARDTAATGAPANTVVAVFLTGGSEGTPVSFSDWTDAFTQLKKRRVNIIIPLSQDPAIHNLLLTQLIDRAGVLRSEANGYVGLGTESPPSSGTFILPTLSETKTLIQALNTRHISAIAQSPKRFDPDTGENVFWPPYQFAAIAGGMQAGSVVGEPLTFKLPLITDFTQDSSWNPIDNASELIDAGLMFSEAEDGLGIRWVRSLTTHLKDDNVVFTEMSANESTNIAVFSLRRQLEIKIGARGLGGSIPEITGLAQNILEDLVAQEIIVAFRSLSVGQVADVFPVSVEISPVLPINFIPITVHLVAAGTAAA